jgi:PhnO protein
METIIRRAEKKDLKTIYSFICDLEKNKFDLQVFEKIFYENLITDKNIYLVAENESGIILGYISCHGQMLLHHCDCVFEIQEFYVENNFRKLGVGSALIKALEKEIANLHHSLIEVTANKSRLATHKFYLAKGFQETHKKFSKSIPLGK